ncbi:PfaB family protein [aff. Roholtiella sp. LEGE 12411]|uniref:PfaB family protein n=1 Tax=aff. Roholtiella sp. LEGE 12411 TaxID=1828822 RepID=UPI00187EE4A4|nr:type I polyketide synthase [aff. Roholtiella sp. LEGE 12411]MBE9033940.1 type I polyketide synthase [aff. Roholtiella sp. LEGE 12411]
MSLEQESISITQPVPLAKIAIVGMDAFFGECNGLDAFERSIYEGKQHFISLPPKRWYGIEEKEDLLKEYGLADGKAPLGAYITDFEIDYLAYKIPPNELEKLNPQQLLLLKVTHRALKDANIPEGGNVAVIIAAETEFSVHQLQQRWNLSWQIKDGLNAANISLSADKIAQLETIVKDSVHSQVDIGEYLSYIANIMASRISALWNFTGPAFTVTAVETSAFKALEVAQMLLTTGEVDAVVVGAVDLAGGVENVLLRNQLAKINTGVNTLSYDQKANGWMIGEGAGAVVLKRYETAQQNGGGCANACANTSSDRIYAVIDAISFGQGHKNEEIINQVCKQAFQMADIQSTDVNYVEVCGSGIPQEDEAEITGLLQAYCQSDNSQNCALGSVKSNIGHTYVASGIASLIKAALCLHYRYIPATPNWSGVKTPQVWEGSPFYVATESRPWFLSKDGTRRIAAVNSMGIDGSYAHLILSEEPNQKERSSSYLQQKPFYLFPLAAVERSNLLEALDNLQQTIENCSSLSVAANQTFITFKERSQTNYVIAIAGRNQQELVKEIESARKGINSAFEQDADWQTPIGSYFTAKPLGKKGEIAYVYPAAVNSYLGIARNLFRLFPKAFEDLKSNNLYNRATEVEKLVYPRSLNKLSTRQLENLEKQLHNNTLVMFEEEMFVTRLITTIIRDDFQVKPKYVFGYSLGEVSMMIAQGVWSNFYQGSNIFNSSALFRDRLSGPKNAVREYWGLPKASSSTDNNFWSNYILIASPSQVREYLKNENRVYLTQINTSEEVVIAGETAACERLINTLGCNAFPAPFDYVIHCEAMRSEYEEIRKLNTLPSQNIPDIVFYSAAEYQPITLDNEAIGVGEASRREAIAHSIAKVQCEQLDFPRLVNRVYDDGAKIFVEAGAGGVCSRLIDTILKNKEHITVSLNRRGIDDHTSIIKALAKLLSHQVDLDLSPLYCLAKETANQSQTTLRIITLGGNSITAKILSHENRKFFQNQTSKFMREPVVQQHQTIPNVREFEIINFSTNPSIIDNDSFPFQEQLQSSKSNVHQQKINQSVPNSATVSNNCGHPVALLNFSKSQYQKLIANNSSINKAHIAFLEARQESSKQLSAIIQLQLSAIENLLNQ